MTEQRKRLVVKWSIYMSIGMTLVVVLGWHKCVFSVWFWVAAISASEVADLVSEMLWPKPSQPDEDAVS